MSKLKVMKNGQWELEKSVQTAPPVHSLKDMVKAAGGKKVIANAIHNHSLTYNPGEHHLLAREYVNETPGLMNLPQGSKDAFSSWMAGMHEKHYNNFWKTHYPHVQSPEDHTHAMQDNEHAMEDYHSRADHYKPQILADVEKEIS